MNTVMTFLSMEGAGIYIWPPYVLALILMLGLWAWSWWMMRRREREAGLLSEQASMRAKATETGASSS